MRIGALLIHRKEQWDRGYIPIVAVHCRYDNGNASRRIFSIPPLGWMVAKLRRRLFWHKVHVRLRRRQSGIERVCWYETWQELHELDRLFAGCMRVLGSGGRLPCGPMSGSRLSDVAYDPTRGWREEKGRGE